MICLGSRDGEFRHALRRGCLDKLGVIEGMAVVFQALLSIPMVLIIHPWVNGLAHLW